MGQSTGGGTWADAALAPADGRSAASPVPVSKDATEDVEALIAELREAARHAGIQRDDPMMPLLTTLAHQIRFLANRTATSDRVATETSAKIIDALQQSRQAADTEIARFQAGIAQTETATIQRIADSIAKTADRALTRRVAVLQWQLVLGAAGILVLVAAGCLGGGYWWGRDNTLASIHETETGLQDSLRARRRRRAEMARPYAVEPHHRRLRAMHRRPRLHAGWTQSLQRPPLDRTPSPRPSSSAIGIR
jgi:hypothetical protein